MQHFRFRGSLNSGHSKNCPNDEEVMEQQPVSVAMPGFILSIVVVVFNCLGFFHWLDDIPEFRGHDFFGEHTLLFKCNMMRITIDRKVSHLHALFMGKAARYNSGIQPLHSNKVNRVHFARIFPKKFWSAWPKEIRHCVLVECPHRHLGICQSSRFLLQPQALRDSAAIRSGCR